MDIKDVPRQCIMMAIRIEWTRIIEDAINSSTKLNAVLNWIDDEISCDTSISTLFVELKERTNEMINVLYPSIDCITWQKQIRAYERDGNQFYISMYTNDIEYGLEFCVSKERECVNTTPDALTHFIFESARSDCQIVSVLQGSQCYTMQFINWIAFLFGRHCTLILPTEPHTFRRLIKGCIYNGFLACIDIMNLTYSPSLITQYLSIAQAEVKASECEGIICVLCGDISIPDKYSSFRYFTVPTLYNFNPKWKIIHAENDKDAFETSASLDNEMYDFIKECIDVMPLITNKEKLQLMFKHLSENTKPLLVFGPPLSGKTKLIECAISNTYRVFRVHTQSEDIIYKVYKKLANYASESFLLLVDVSTFDKSSIVWLSNLLSFVRHGLTSRWIGDKRYDSPIRLIIEYGGRQSNIPFNTLCQFLPIISIQQPQTTIVQKWQMQFVSLIVSQLLGELRFQIPWLPDTNTVINTVYNMSIDFSTGGSHYPECVINVLLHVLRAYSDYAHLIDQVLRKLMKRIPNVQLPSITSNIFNFIYSESENIWTEEFNIVTHITRVISQLRSSAKAIMLVGTKWSLWIAREILHHNVSEQKEIVLLSPTYSLENHFNKYPLVKTLIIHGMPYGHQSDFLHCLLERNGYLCSTDVSYEWIEQNSMTMVILADGSNLKQLDECTCRLLARFEIVGLPDAENNQIINYLSEMHGSLVYNDVENVFSLLNDKKPNSRLNVINSCQRIYSRLKLQDKPVGEIVRQELTGRISDKELDAPIDPEYDKLQFLKQCNIEEITKLIPYNEMYKKFVLIKDALKFEFECFILIGPRGCGRHTVLKHACQTELPPIVNFIPGDLMNIVNHVTLKDKRNFGKGPVFVICDNEQDLPADLVIVSTLIYFNTFTFNDFLEIVEYLIDKDAQILQMIARILRVITAPSINNQCLCTIPMIEVFIENYQATLETQSDKHGVQHVQRITALSKVDQIFKELDELHLNLDNQRTKLEEKQRRCELITDRMGKLSDMQSKQRDHIIEIKQQLDQKLFTIEREKRQAEEVLADVMPLLDNAKKALENISKDNIAEMRSFTTPPRAVALVGNCIVAYLGNKPKSTKEPVDMTWSKVKKVMGDGNFLNNLQSRNPSDVSEYWINSLRKNLTKLRDHLLKDRRPSLNNNELLITAMESKSHAGAGLLQYVLAVDQYIEVSKVIQPKLDNVKELDSQCQQGKSAIEKLQDNVRTIDKKIKDYETLLSKAQAEQFEIEEANNIMESHANVCERLASAFKLEKQRWEEELSELKHSVLSLPYDVAMQCAYFIFSGHLERDVSQSPFNTIDTTCQDWARALGKIDNPSRIHNMLPKFISPKEKLAVKASISHLADYHSAIIALTSTISVIIDPYERMTDYFVREKSYKLISFNLMSKTAFDNALDEAMKLGHTVFVDGCVFDDDAMDRIILNDIAFHPQFAICFSIKEYSQFPVEYAGRVRVATCYGSGIDQYTIWALMKYEKPRIYEEYLKYIQQASIDSVDRDELDQVLLVELIQSTGSILNNESLLKTLEEASEKSVAIENRLKNVVLIEQRIRDERERYDSIGARLNNLYSMMTNRLAKVNEFFGMPVNSYVRIIDKGLDELVLATGNIVNSADRLSFVENYVTCTFVRVLELSMTRNENLLLNLLLSLFINDGLNSPEVMLMTGQIENFTFNFEEWPSWIELGQWRRLNAFQLSVFPNIIQIIQSNKVQWEEYLQQDEDVDWDSLPNVDMTHLQRFLLLSTIWPQRTGYFLQCFVTNDLNEKFVSLKDSAIDMDDIMNLTTEITPFIVIHEDLTLPILPCKLNKQDPYNGISLIQAASAFSDEVPLQMNAANIDEEQLSEAFTQCQSKGRWLVISNSQNLDKAEIQLIERYLLVNLENSQVDRRFRLWLVLSHIPATLSNLLNKSIRLRSIDDLVPDANVSESSETLKKLHNVLTNRQLCWQHRPLQNPASWQQIVQWPMHRKLTQNEIKPFIKNVSCGFLCSHCNGLAIDGIINHIIEYSELLDVKLGDQRTPKYSALLNDELIKKFVSRKETHFDSRIINCILKKSLVDKTNNRTVISILNIYTEIIDNHLLANPIKSKRSNPIHSFITNDYHSFLERVKETKCDISRWAAVETDESINQAIEFSEPLVDNLSLDDWIDKSYQRMMHYGTLLNTVNPIEIRLDYLCNPELFIIMYFKLKIEKLDNFVFDAKIMTQSVNQDNLILLDLRLYNGSVDNHGINPLQSKNHKVNLILMMQSNEEKNKVVIPIRSRSNICCPLLTIRMDSLQPQSMFDLFSTYFTI